MPHNKTLAGWQVKQDTSLGEALCGIGAGRSGNRSATIETATSIMAISRQKPVRDGTVVSTTGDGLLGPPTTAI
ncbi:MAG TPA: hypothetical protein VK390_08670 [Propionibacteriaceae bacterium]|nr:hypothetical protein [Propionibacteriaceae bacterium]